MESFIEYESIKTVGESMLFSVLVPVYNVEKYLPQCIESIINQTEQDFELILVDDGSEDSSGKICDEYQSKFPDHIRVIHQENKGLILTRRVSIAEARGEYCIFVDSDDYLRKNALETIKRTINENCVDLVIYNYVKVNDEGHMQEHPPVFSNKKIITEQNKRELYEKIIKDDSLNNIWLKAVRTRIIDKDVNYFSARHVSNGEDLLQTLPIVTQSQRIIYIDEPLYYYRQNMSSMTNVFNLKWYDSVAYVFRQLTKYAKIWGMDTKYENDLLRQRYVQVIINAIRQLAYPSCRLGFFGKKHYLSKLANDENFIDAYDSVQLNNVGMIWRVTLGLLRKKQILLVQLITDIRRFMARLSMK